MDLKLVPQLQEDDCHSDDAIPTNKARALPSETYSVVLDQMAACDITMPNLIFAKVEIQACSSWMDSPRSAYLHQREVKELCDPENFQHRVVIYKG